MVAKAKVRIEGEDATAAAWKSATARAQSNAKAMSHAFEAAFAGVSLAAIAEVARESIELGDNLNKAAIKAGIGGKAMSELAYAAKLADVDLSGLSTGLKKMQVALSEAATGAKLPNEALAALGLTIKEIKDLSPDKQFELIGDRISKLTDPADRARAATELFGKAGADLLPLFSEGAEGIAKARREAEQLGVAFTDDQLQRLTDASDAVKRLGAAWHGFATTLTAEVAPALTQILNGLAGTRQSQLEQQIKFLEKVQGEGFISANPLGKYGAYQDIGTGIFSADEGAKKLAQLRQMLALENLRNNPNGQGGPGTHPHSGTGSGAPPGFVTDNAAEIAAAQKKDEQLRQLDFSMSQDLSDEADKALKDDMKREVERLDAADEWYKTWQENYKKLAVYQEEQSRKLSEGAQIFKDAFTNAIEDMINTGKLNFGEFFKYIIAEFARRGIAKLFDSIFNGQSSSGGGGGLWSSIGSAIGSIFGGSGGGIDGKAAGGPVSAGTSYLVGERGMELFTPGTHGTITPNNKLGGGTAVTIVNHIDARGATTDFVKALPTILDQTSKATEARIVERLRRKHYGPIQTA